MAEYPDRTQLQQIIAGMNEGVILIEPDGVITYANHSSLEMHGVDVLDDLGRSVDAYLRNYVVINRTGEALEAGQTPVERAAAGEWFDILVEVRRRDWPEQHWTHRVRSLVVKTPAGLPDCHILVSADMTGHAEAEDRFNLMFAANPAPAAICRLSDLRFVKVNEGFLRLSGYAHADVIGHSVYEIDVLERAENRELAIQRLKAGETIPQMEACLRFPQQPEHFVIVAGQPIEIGSERCMLFTFADLEDRRKAETALARSEERFAKSFRLTPVPTIISTVERRRIVDVNEAFVKAIGYRIEEVVGRTSDDLQLWTEASARERFEGMFSEAGGVRAFDAKFNTKDGATLDCLVSAEVVTIANQRCCLFALQDITERKRSEGELVTAIEAAMAETSFSRGVIEKLAALRQLAGPVTFSVRLQDLTKREREILGLICRGARDAEIGTALNLSPHTVRNHIASLYKKLGLNRRSDVVIWARERGLDGTSQIEVSDPRRKG